MRQNSSILNVDIKKAWAHICAETIFNSIPLISLRICQFQHSKWEPRNGTETKNWYACFAFSLVWLRAWMYGCMYNLQLWISTLLQRFFKAALKPVFRGKRLKHVFFPVKGKRKSKKRTYCDSHSVQQERIRSGMKWWERFGMKELNRRIREARRRRWPDWGTRMMLEKE